MSYGSPLDVKQRVRDATDIVDLVGRYVELRRSGRHFVARCPWHDDTRPSLQINPERQSWKCWVCDIGGDVFSFVMKMEGVDFKEALHLLADRVGVRVAPVGRAGGGRSPSPETSADAAFETTPSSTGSGQDAKKAMYRAMAWVEGVYHDCLLNDPAAESARRYLDERGISEESIRAFHLGFSPSDGEWIVRRVGRNPSRLKVLEAIGILARSDGARLAGGHGEGGSFYDRFRGRVLFPIRDVQQRPVGIGGRVLPEAAATTRAKYVNSPETPLFAKNRLLYGLDLARETIRRTRQVLVMEGYTDVIVAHQFGFTNAVAVLGTALGEQHVRMFRNFDARVLLVLDGDEAGQRRTAELLGLFLSRSVDVRTLMLPGGSDPCDFLQQRGAESFQRLLETESVDVFEHVYRMHTRGVDIERDLHGSARAMENILREVAKAPRFGGDSGGEQRLRVDVLLRRVAERFRIEERELRERLSAIRRAEPRRVAPEAVGKFVGTTADHKTPTEGEGDAEAAARPLDVCERALVQLVLRHPAALAALRAEIPLERVEHPAARWFYRACARLEQERVEPTFDRLMLETDDPTVKSLLVELDEDISQRADKMLIDQGGWVGQVIRGFQQRDLARRRAVDPGLLRREHLDSEQKTELLQELLEKKRARYGISDPKEG